MERETINAIAFITFALSIVSSCMLCYFCNNKNRNNHGRYVFNTRVIPQTIQETTL